MRTLFLLRHNCFKRCRKHGKWELLKQISTEINFSKKFCHEKSFFWQEKKHPLDSTALLLVNVSVHDVVMETTLFACKG